MPDPSDETLIEVYVAAHDAALPASTVAGTTPRLDGLAADAAATLAIVRAMIAASQLAA